MPATTPPACRDQTGPGTGKAQSVKPISVCSFSSTTATASKGRCIRGNWAHYRCPNWRPPPLCYRRLKQHLNDVNEEQYLVTVPRRSAIRFSQGGRDTECRPGAFLLEHGQSPYEFSYARDNALWVLKVPGESLRARLHTPNRYCALAFDATQGAGWLFASYVNLIGQQLLRGDDTARHVLGQHLVELLACSVEGDARVLSSQDSPVRNAHLSRIEHYVRQHLGNADLNPTQVAQACGISVRYLHSLYQGQGQTFSEWLCGQRLERAHHTLLSASALHSIARIAQQWGFADQAHFSRLYKRRYGYPPSQARRAGLAA